jgi:hypothetical protein
MIRKQCVSLFQRRCETHQPCAVKRQGPAEPRDSLGAWGQGKRLTCRAEGLGKGLRAAAHKARNAGNVTPAEALDITRFEVYESSLDEELHQQGEPSR